MTDHLPTCPFRCLMTLIPATPWAAAVTPLRCYCGHESCHLCARHAAVARRRLKAWAAKEAKAVARMDAETERMRPKAEAEMTTLRRRIAQLNPPSRADGAVVNMALRLRMPTDAQITELATAWERLRRLEARFGRAQ